MPPLDPPTETIQGCLTGHLHNALDHQGGKTPKDKLDLFSGLATPVEVIPPTASLVEALGSLDEVVAQGRAQKEPVRAATTGALAANTRTGNTLEANANGALASQDGISLAVADRLLVKDEATAANNGIYRVVSLGGGGSKWSLIRTHDADSDDDFSVGCVVAVRSGTTHAGKTFVCTASGITLNTTALNFTTPAGGGDLLAANALSELTGVAATARSNIGAEAAGTAAAAIVTHVAATDPHGDRAYTDAALAAYLLAHGFTWRGAWSGATAYVGGDAVSKDGSSYFCILGHTNQAPPNVTYWDVIALKGDTGAAGADGTDGADGADGATGATGPGYLATSTSSVSLAVGSRNFTTQSGLAYQANDRVRMSVTSGGGHYMEGVVAFYSGTTLVVTVQRVVGTPGTYSAWNIGIAGDVGDTGATGAPGADGVDGADGADGTAIAIYKSGASAKAGPNSASEVALLTVSTTLQADQRLEIIAHGQIFANSGSTRTCTFRLKFGSTTLVTSVALSCAVSASKRFWKLTAYVFGFGGTSAQEGYLDIVCSNNGLSSGSSGPPSLALMSLGRGTAAEDASSAKNLVISAQMSASEANVECELLGACVTKL